MTNNQIYAGIDPYKEESEITELKKRLNSYFYEDLKNIQRLYDESIVNDLINYTPKPKIEVKIVNDNDGHMYVIPAYLRKEFMELLGRALISGDHSNFISRFSGYMKNPDDLKLYTNEI